MQNTGLIRPTGLLLLFSLWCCSTSTWAQELPINTQLGGNFSLTSAQNKQFELNALKNQVILLTFGFTHCVHSCPFVLSKYTQLLKTLGAQAQEVKLLFITVNPEQDTPAHLQHFLANFDARIIGLTGSPAQLKQIAHQYGAVFTPSAHPTQTPHKTDDIPHTDRIYLLDQQHRIRMIYPLDTAAERIQADIKALLR